MKRNSVKSGLFDQRNRATQRRRQKQVLIDQNDPKANLIAWLEESKISATNLLSINLTEFLRSTEGFDIPSEERLRQLAIHLEFQAQSLPGESGWHALKRIYDFAIKLDENNEVLWHSMAIAAHEMADDNQKSEQSKSKIFRAGKHAILTAMSIRPDWGDAHYMLGHLYYFQDKKEAALKEYEKALECENEDKVHSWAQLYKAHCFHDMQEWDKAIESYTKVDLSAFSGAKAWRTDILREQIAECTHKIGKKEEAQNMLLKIIERYEAEPKLAYCAMSFSLWNLARSLSTEMHDRVKRIEEMAWKE